MFLSRSTATLMNGRSVLGAPGLSSIVFVPIGQDHPPCSLWFWWPEQTGQAQVSGQGSLGRGNEENICLALACRRPTVSSHLRQTSALALCLRLSVLVFIWADETTEELCSHHPCPRGSQRRGCGECLTSHGCRALLLLSCRGAGTGRFTRHQVWASQGCPARHF